MSLLKAVVVDDERLARHELGTLLRDAADVEIVGEAATVDEAAKLMEAVQPDILFLDIAMPGRNGFELLESLPQPRPFVIFTTAFPSFAVRAFEEDAVDYLLKPISPRRLGDSLEKVRLRISGGGARARTAASDAASELPLSPEDHVFVREGERCWLVPVRSIRELEAEGNYTRVHFDGGSPLLYRTLVSMEARLPEKLFLRANRSQLVNLSFIESVEPWFSGAIKVRLKGGRTVEFSRRQAQLFRERLTL